MKFKLIWILMMTMIWIDGAERVSEYVEGLHAPW